MTFEWPSWVDPLPFPFPELHNCSYFLIMMMMTVTTHSTWQQEGRGRRAHCWYVPCHLLHAPRCSPLVDVLQELGGGLLLLRRELRPRPAPALLLVASLGHCGLTDNTRSWRCLLCRHTHHHIIIIITIITSPSWSDHLYHFITILSSQAPGISLK